MPFLRKCIDLKFELLNKAFAATGQNIVTLKGMRVSAQISKAGGMGHNCAQVRVFGLSMSLANQISTLGKVPYKERGNKITILPYDEGTMPAVAFYGDISQAWVDMQSAPDVSLTVEAFTGMVEQMRPLPPTSYAGAVDAATVLASIAGQMSWTFKNNGASVMLSNPYYAGTGREQAYACAHDAGINITMDDGDVLEIWPEGGSRGGAVPLVSADTGMVGSPSYTQQGLSVQCLYNPAIQSGGKIKVQSGILPQANGTWWVQSLAHNIESETPGGAWFSTADCTIYGSDLNG